MSSLAAVLPGIRRQILIRLAAFGTLLALAAGVVSYVFAVDVLDSLVHRMAVEQATRLTHVMDRMAGRMNRGEVDLGGFVFARVISAQGDTIQERWQDEVGDTLRGRVRDLIDQTVDGDRHLTFRDGGRLFIFVSVAIDDSQQRFLGIYQIDDAVHTTLNRQVAWSVAGVALSAILALAVLVPVMLGLERRVIRHARDAVDANLDALLTLGNAIAQRDSDTDAHNYRVTVYAVRLAQHMGLDDKAIRHLIRGAFLHDVGKIGISDAILLKPAKLTDDEFAVMKTHVTRGLKIVGRSRWLEPAAAVIAGHHERFDGSGYPQGLAGDAIPLAARIFAVVDVFDALTSKRPYKEPLSLDEAKAILAEGRGRHFDPVVLDRFFEIADALYAECCIADEDCARRQMGAELHQRFL